MVERRDFAVSDRASASMTGRSGTNVARQPVLGVSCVRLDLRNERGVIHDASATTDFVGRDSFSVGPPRLRRQPDNTGVVSVPDDQAVVAVYSLTPPVPGRRIHAPLNTLGEVIA